MIIINFTRQQAVYAITWGEQQGEVNCDDLTSDQIGNLMRESKLLSVLTADRKANIMQDLWSRVTPAAWLTLAALPSTNPRFWHWVMINNALQAAADEVLYTEEARTARKHTLEPDDELGLPTNPQEVKHFRRTAPEPDIMLDSML